jgi:hypothetical protein
MRTNVHIASQRGATSKLVTTAEKICFKLDYPVRTPLLVTATSKGGFTLKAFARVVLRGYKKIYKEPNKYGVWGHGLADLYLEGIKRIKRQGSLSVFHVEIGS